MAVITSLARVLRCFETHQELSVARLTEELALPKSTVSRLMQDMARVGLLAQDPATRRYRPGPLLAAAAQHHRASAGLLDLAGAALDGLVERFGHTGFIMGLQGAQVVTLRAKIGTRAIRVHTADHLIGGPAYVRSPGRALLARLGDDAVRALHPGPLMLPAPAPQTLDELMPHLRRIRATRVSEAYGEAIPGVGGISVAAGTSAEDAVGVNLTFAAELVRPKERREIAAALLDAGQALARQLHDPCWPLEAPAPRRASR